MNERIEGLWWQARIGYNNQNCDPEVLVKFAESIVKECVIRAEREWIRNGSDTEHNQAVSQVIESIKQHFGIEYK